MILLYCRNPIEAVPARRALTEAGEPFAECADWPGFRALAGKASAAVVVAPWLRTDVPLDELRLFQAEHPSFPCVVVTGPEPENLRHLVGITAARVLFWRHEVKLLPAAVRAASAGAFFDRVAARIQAGMAGQPGLRRALVYCLRLQPAPDGGALDAEAAPARSIRTVAARIGYSERYLFRAARETDVDLRAFLDWCLTLKALQLRESTDATWEAVGWRLGFNSGSGLSELLLRTLGTRPAQLGPGASATWQAAFERGVVDPLLQRRAAALKKGPVR